MLLKDIVFDEKIVMENRKEVSLYFTAPVGYLSNYFDIEINEGDVSMEIWLEFPDDTLNPEMASVVAVSPTNAEGSDYDWHDVLLDYNTIVGLIAMAEKAILEKKLKKAEEERSAFLLVAYNAICLGQLDEAYSEDDLWEELGCSKEIYEKIME